MLWRLVFARPSSDRGTIHCLADVTVSCVSFPRKMEAYEHGISALENLEYDSVTSSK